jgi:hypothetical protein
MGLMDKVKAQATQLAQKTQETAREGKARLDQAQANRHGDLLMRNLGALVYAEQTGRGTPESPDQVARLIVEISAHEAENGINLSSQPTGPAGGVPPQDDSGAPAGPGSTPFADPGSSSSPPGDSTSYPASGGSTAFPDSGGSTAFPDSGGSTTFPESGGSTTFPQSGGGTAFPPEAGSSPGS